MDKYEGIALEFPNEYVQAFNGFAIDIGCSTAKVVYRSKEDYENGKPKKEELKSDMGRVYMIPTIARTELDDVMELIRTKCDLVRNGNERMEITSTGAGCNLFKAELEQGLNISLNNVMEFECFVKAFLLIARLVPEDDLFFEPCHEVKEAAKAENLLMKEMMEKITNNEDFNIDNEPVAEDQKGPILPCIIGMCGSGVAFMQVDEDGAWKAINITPLGGRMFLGLSALMTGKRDFSQIYAAIERGSLQSVDEFSNDLVATNEKEGDTYGFMKKFEKPIMSFGKAVTRDRDQVKDDDILHSLYRVWVRNIIAVGIPLCMMNKVYNLYFCGNFINNEKARNEMTHECETMGKWVSKEQPIRLEFIKHGGHLGALGALMKATEKDNQRE